MDLRPLCDTCTTAPMIDPEDMAQLAEAGFTTIICNRPDSEVPPSHHAAAMEAAAEASGMAFVYNPMTMPNLTLDTVEEQADAIEGATGKVLVYCRSGTRSALLWALAQAGQRDTDDILNRLEQAGYPMPHLGGQIDALAVRGAD